jgi:polysaccharide deacetylase family protein (PEP-CTERM system associated)
MLEMIGVVLKDEIRNAFTIDVEDYFQVSAFAQHIKRSEWNSWDCRVERNVDLILSMLDKHNTKATFFTLGWIAERYPLLISKIANQGHEVASHGYGHERASDLSKDAFLQDISVAKRILEDVIGSEVSGYRAPSFSIGKSNLWAFDCIRDAGYRYSSSVYPIQHDHYGMPDSPRFSYLVRPNLLEIPVTTLRLFGRNLPSSGGGYFRLFPYALSRWMPCRANKNDNQSGIFYFHPWEVDPLQPRIPSIGLKTKFRHYVNIGRMEARLNQLLGDFNWGRMDQVFQNAIPKATVAAA